MTTSEQCAVYLQVAVDDVEGVQIRHCLHHLPDHIAGVLLRVVALVQNPVKHLSPCSTASKSDISNVKCFTGLL